MGEIPGRQIVDDRSLPAKRRLTQGIYLSQLRGQLLTCLAVSGDRQVDSIAVVLFRNTLDGCDETANSGMDLCFRNWWATGRPDR